MAVADHAQDQVAEVQAEAGHIDRADDDADDDAADAHADGAAAALHRRLHDGLEIHARLPAEERHGDGHKNCDNRGEQRRIAGEHQRQQHDQRNEQMAARPKHLACLGDVLLRKAGKAEPLGLQVHRVEQGKVIQERRNRRRQHHLRVADAHKFRHDKADCAHDRRGELATGGGHRLDRRREILLVARFFHQRNGDRAGRRHVGDGRAVNHAHQRGSDHRHLRRTAGGLPHQRQRDIVDELGKAAVFEKRAEEHEHEDIRRGNARARTENAVGIPHQCLDDALERKGARAERAGDVLAPDREIRQEDQRDDGQIAARAPRRLKGDQQADHADPHVRRVQPPRSCHRVVSQEQIAVAENRRGNQGDIPNRHEPAAAAFLFERRIQREGQRQQKHDVRRAQLDRAERAEHVRPNLKRGPDQQHRRQRLFHRADIHAQAAVGVLVFHQLLRFVVKLRLRDDLFGFFHTFSSDARAMTDRAEFGYQCITFCNILSTCMRFFFQTFQKAALPRPGKSGLIKV